MTTEICLRYEMSRLDPYEHIEGNHTQIDIAIVSMSKRETSPCYQDLGRGIFLREFKGDIEGNLTEKLRVLKNKIKNKTGYNRESTNMPCDLDEGCEKWEKEYPGGPFEIHYGVFGAGHWPIKGETEEQRIAKEKEEEIKNSEMHDKILPIFERFAQEIGLVSYL